MKSETEEQKHARIAEQMKNMVLSELVDSEQQPAQGGRIPKEKQYTYGSAFRDWWEEKIGLETYEKQNTFVTCRNHIEALAYDKVSSPSPEANAEERSQWERMNCKLPSESKTADDFLKSKGIKDTLYDVKNPIPNQWIKGGLSELLQEYARQGDVKPEVQFPDDYNTRNKAIEFASECSCRHDQIVTEHNMMKFRNWLRDEVKKQINPK